MRRTRVIVLGAGSVGRRHLRNLAELGCSVAAFDPQRDRIAQAGSEVSLDLALDSEAEAIRVMSEFDGVVVASPPSVHAAQAIAALEAGVPVLLEKPPTTSLADAEAVALAQTEHASPLLLGYTYRWWEPLVELRRRLDDGAVGRPLSARFLMSANLEDWHPWERYQDFFMSSEELGGGALLDESHFTDLMIWFFGSPDSLYAQVERLSDLEIGTDDSVEILASWDSGLRASIHLDLYGRPHEKRITIVGTDGTLDWSFDPNQLRYSRTAEGSDWVVKEWSLDRNDMFLAMAAHFLDVIRSGETVACDARDAVSVMRVIEACRVSNASRRSVRVAPEEVH